MLQCEGHWGQGSLTSITDNALSLGFQFWAPKTAEGRRQALLFPLASKAKNSNLIKLKSVLIHNIWYRFLTCNKKFNQANLKLFWMSQMPSEAIRLLSPIFSTVYPVAQVEHWESCLIPPPCFLLNFPNTNGHLVLKILPS